MCDLDKKYVREKIVFVEARLVPACFQKVTWRWRCSPS
jgi:hypothetical protein